MHIPGWISTLGNIGTKFSAWWWWLLFWYFRRTEVLKKVFVKLHLPKDHAQSLQDEILKDAANGDADARGALAGVAKADLSDKHVLFLQYRIQRQYRKMLEGSVPR